MGHAVTGSAASGASTAKVAIHKLSADPQDGVSNGALGTLDEFAFAIEISGGVVPCQP